MISLHVQFINLTGLGNMAGHKNQYCIVSYFLNCGSNNVIQRSILFLHIYLNESAGKECRAQLTSCEKKILTIFHVYIKFKMKVYIFSCI
jgi:hypothetical protein